MIYQERADRTMDEYLDVRDGQQAGAYILLDLRTGEVVAKAASHPGSGTPMDVWLGQARRFRTAQTPTPEGMDSIIDDLWPLLEQVYEGGTIEWDGSNHVGVLTEDAQRAEDEIRERIERDYDHDWWGWLVWHPAEDWLYAGGLNDLYTVAEMLGITAESTDEELDAIVEREQLPENIWLVGLEGVVYGLREKLRERDC